MAKPQDLAGGELAIYVALAQGWRIERESGCYICFDPQGNVYSFGEHGYRPDKNPAQAWPIIDREKIGFAHTWEGVMASKWVVNDRREGGRFHKQTADDALTAAMRCYVASVFGDTLPEVLP